MFLCVLYWLRAHFEGTFIHFTLFVFLTAPQYIIFKIVSIITTFRRTTSTFISLAMKKRLFWRRKSSM
jgi:hypothetical protein